MADAESPEKTASPAQIPLDRLPAGIRRLVTTFPQREWYKLRSFLIESEEEGDLAEMLPQANRAMKICPNKIVRRIRLREITGEQVDEAYNRLHDAIHGVRKAFHELFRLSGMSEKPPRRDVRPTRTKAAGKEPVKTPTPAAAPKTPAAPAPKP